MQHEGVAMQRNDEENDAKHYIRGSPRVSIAGMGCARRWFMTAVRSVPPKAARKKEWAVLTTIAAASRDI